MVGPPSDRGEPPLKREVIAPRKSSPKVRLASAARIVNRPPANATAPSIEANVLRRGRRSPPAAYAGNRENASRVKPSARKASILLVVFGASELYRPSFCAAAMTPL